jgi:hypothetical protein
VGFAAVTSIWALTSVSGLWYALVGSLVTLLAGVCASFFVRKQEI